MEIKPETIALEDNFPVVIVGLNSIRTLRFKEKTHLELTEVFRIEHVFLEKAFMYYFVVRD